jgi:hypothetical protein
MFGSAYGAYIPSLNIYGAGRDDLYDDEVRCRCWRSEQAFVFSLVYSLLADVVSNSCSLSSNDRTFS